MSKRVIQVQNLSKRFLLQHQDNRAFSVAISEGLKHLFFRKKRKDIKEFWALENISFDIQQGEIVSLVGDNGSGKSTLLKIIANIMQATSGTVKTDGSMRALLEVGTGFHFELSGRENIFFNSALFGISRAETQKHLDEIIDFSGIEEYLDIPIKYYSSGMRIRLGFAVSTQFRPDILILDEVLTVGDLGFRKKSLERIRSITENHGTTTLFVSHNLYAAQSLCDKAIWINQGKMLAFDFIDEVLAKYKKEVLEFKGQELKLSRDLKQIEPILIPSSNLKKKINQNNHIQLQKIWVENKGVKENAKGIFLKYPIDIGVEFSILNHVGKIDITFQFTNELDDIFMVSSTAFDENMQANFPKGNFKITCTIPPYFLNSGIVYINLIIHLNKEKPGIYKKNKILSFMAIPDMIEFGIPHRKSRSSVRPKLDWSVEEVGKGNAPRFPKGDLI